MDRRVYLTEGRARRSSRRWCTVASQCVGALVDARLIETIDKAARRRGERYVTDLAKAARASGVASETYVTRPVTPYRGVIDAAKRKKCDSISIGFPRPRRDRLAHPGQRDPERAGAFPGSRCSCIVEVLPNDLAA